MARRQAKATRKHSTVAKHPDDGPAGADLVVFVVARLGEVATLFRVLGWSGDSGADVDRLSVRVPAGFRLGVEGGGGFAASVSDLIPALMMCVASAALSLALSSSLSCAELAAFALVLRLLAFFRILEFAAGRSALEAGLDVAVVVSVSVSSSSLTVTTVVVVHDEVDAIDALTASDFACNEAI